MVNQNNKYDDGFFVVLKTQAEENFPPELENKIIQKLKNEQVQLESEWKIFPIFFLCFMCLLLLSLATIHPNSLSSYFFFLQLKQGLLLLILVYGIYELNLILPQCISWILSFKKKIIHS